MSKAKTDVAKHAKAGKANDTQVKETKDRSGAINGFIRKLSGGLMIPIALLPLAGLFLGVGAGFENVYFQVSGATSTLGSWAYIFTIFKMIGDMIFGNLPVLFCLGVALAFSDDVGVAVFTGMIAWIVFNATQSTMIWENAGEETYQIGFYKEVPASVVGTNIGITSMQTSVFGGILMGFWAAFMYNKFHEFEMPKVLGFFSGTRFVPIITFLTVPLWGFAFVMIWPIIGIGLEKFGTALAGMPAGIDSFLFGVVERSLIPFGLHHAFYTPLWYTSVGGTLTATGSLSGIITDNVAYGNQSIWFAMQTLGIPYSVLNNIDGNAVVNTYGSWTAVSGTAGLTSIQLDGVEVATLTEGVSPGAYMQGKFPFMLLGLPAAGAAMIMAAKKENREVAMSVIGAAALTSFLTGITEPIEFTFLFLSPILYYGFHIWMAGISFWALDILGSHVGMTFSGGIFDYVLFAILPDATGFHTNSWWILIIGVIYAPIYYFFFYFMIIKLDIKTPGRDDAEVALVSKADYKAAKAAKKGGNDPEFERRLEVLVESLGGIDNMTSINACITKLRLEVKDNKVIDFDRIKKETGAMGFSGQKGKAPMIVYGADAIKFKTAMLKMK